MFRTILRGLLVMAALTSARPASAQEGLRPDLAKLAEVAAAVIKKQGNDSVKIVPFNGPDAIHSAGPGIRRILNEELTRQGITINNKSSLRLRGEYLLRSTSTEVQGLVITMTVTDAEGTPLAIIDKHFNGDGGQIKRVVEDPKLIAQALGGTIPDGGRKPEQMQREDLKKRLDKPSVCIDGTRVKSGPNAKYAFEVHVKRNGAYVPLTPTDEEGLAFAGLDKADVFAINFINDSDYEAAIELTIDGLSNFAFFEKPGYRHLIVKPKSSFLLKGWQRDTKTSDEFLITDYAKGAVKQLGASPDGVGTITVAYAAAWDPAKPANRPPDDQARSKSTNAAGGGESFASPVVEVPRVLGRVRDVVSVRYQKSDVK